MIFQRRNLLSGGNPYVPPPTPSYADTKSVDFDGTDDFGSVAGTTVNAYFTHNSPWTFSTWIKPDAVSGEKTFFSTRDAGSGYKGFLAEQVGSMLLIQLNTAASTRTITKSSALSASVWQHLVVVYSGNQDLSGFTVYLDNVVQTMSGSGTITASTVTTVNPQFGNDPQGSFFNGKIDDTAIFNTDLDSTEVAELYNSGNGYNIGDSSLPNLVAWWLMGDGSADSSSTIFDQVGSADITLNGAVIISDAP